MTEDEAFGPVIYNTKELTAAITDLYKKPQQSVFVEKYRQIVSFHDNRNTERCFKALKYFGYLNCKPLIKTKIRSEMIKGVTALEYTGFPRIQKQIEIKCGKNILAADVDFIVNYENNTGPGTAVVVITGIGKYKGTVRLPFIIE